MRHTDVWFFFLGCHAASLVGTLFFRIVECMTKDLFVVTHADEEIDTGD